MAAADDYGILHPGASGCRSNRTARCGHQETGGRTQPFYGVAASPILPAARRLEDTFKIPRVFGSEVKKISNSVSMMFISQLRKFLKQGSLDIYDRSASSRGRFAFFELIFVSQSKLPVFKSIEKN